MSLTCRVCVHPKRAQIDAALIAGTAARRIAAQFGPSATAIRRHGKGCSPLVAKGKEAAKAAHAGSIAEQVDLLIADMRAIFESVKLDPPDGPIEAARELGRLLELKAKLTGAFAPKVVKHVEVRDMTAREQLDELRQLEGELATEVARLEADMGATLQ